MGSGPVVIGDDGSPPPGAALEKDLDQTYLQVGRYGEKMDELATAVGASHTVGGAHAISRVQISQNGYPYLIVFSPATLVVNGQSTTITADNKAGDGAEIVISAGNRLSAATSVNGWQVYQSTDTKINSVIIDKTCAINTAKPTKIEIFF